MLKRSCYRRQLLPGETPEDLQGDITVMDQGNDAAPRQALHYDGRVGQLYGIFVINLLLTIITIGIYRFWAITRWRRYFWSHMAFQGERFEYTGRGLELFLGFLMAIGILIGLGIATAILVAVLRLIHPVLAVVPIVAVYVSILILAFAARFSAQRYRLSRTLWRGIRGGMTGSALAYGVRSLLYTLLLPFTLFQLVPWMQIRLAEQRINASRLGSAAFSFQGRARSVYLPFVATFIGTLLLFVVIAAVVWGTVAPWVAPFIGDSNNPRLAMAMQRAVPVIIIGIIVFGIGSALIGCWYSALFVRHIIGNTKFDTLPLRSTVTGRALLWLFVGNGLIALFTLGLGLPFVLHRSMRFVARNLLIAGTLDVEALHQSTLAMPHTGEGMLQLLDHGGIL
jgi:uncharacterized membrane protein YjgN (DUF898 family)